MDEITSLKDKHIKVTPSQVKELLERQMKFIDHIKNKENQHFTEDDKKIQDLIAKVASMKETLRSETQTLEDKNRELSKYQDCVRELEIDKCKYLQQNQVLELQKDKLKLCKPNIQDQELLEQGSRKFALYKELTRIRWDFEALGDSVKGYVTNKNDYIQHFCFKPDEKHNVCDLLWQEIFQSTNHRIDKRDANKENIINV